MQPSVSPIPDLSHPLPRRAEMTRYLCSLVISEVILWREDHDFFIIGIDLSGCFHCPNGFFSRVGTVVGHSQMPAFAIRSGVGSILLKIYLS